MEAEEAVRGAEVVLAELRDRAVQHNTLDKDSTFIRGDILKVMKQVRVLLISHWSLLLLKIFWRRIASPSRSFILCR